MGLKQHLGKSLENMMKTQEQYFFKKARKDFEKGKKEIIQGIEDEKGKSGKSTLEVIDTLADENKEDKYWLWLMYTIDLNMEGKKEKIKEKKRFSNEKYVERFSHFSGTCKKCDNEFTFSEEDKDRGDVECDECGQTYKESDMSSMAE